MKSNKPQHLPLLICVMYEQLNIAMLEKTTNN